MSTHDGYHCGGKISVGDHLLEIEGCLRKRQAQKDEGGSFGETCPGSNCEHSTQVYTLSAHDDDHKSPKM